MKPCKLTAVRRLEIFAAVLMMIFVSAPVFGQTGSTVVSAFQNVGIEVRPVTRDGITEYSVTGSTVPITILPNPLVDQRTAAFLRELQSVLGSFTTIAPESVVVTLRTQESTAVVRMRSLTVDSVNLLGRLPEGLVFRYTDSLFYDFSMVVTELRLRIRGQFFSEEELTAKLLRIYSNPSQYLLSQDSEYVMRYMFQVSEENARILAELEQARQTIAALEQEVENSKRVMYEEFTAARDEITDRIDAGFAETADTFEAVRGELAETGSELASAIDENREESDALTGTLRDAVILLNTRGFFGGLNDFERDAVERLIAWRSTQPDTTTFRMAQDWVRSQELELSNKLIQVALIVYFNQVE